MQAHQSPKNVDALTEDSRGAGLPPIKTFLVLALVLVAVIAAAVATRPRAELRTTEVHPAEPNSALSEEEAIERFEELHKLFRQASMQRDMSLVPLMLSDDSRLGEIARRDIGQLRRDNVLDRSLFRTESVEVIKNTSQEIRIEQVVVVKPRFLDDATHVRVRVTGPVRQRVIWTLKLDGTEWKVYDALVVERERLTR